MQHAISTLQAALEVAQTNEPILRNEGQTEEADLRAEQAESFQKAINLLGHYESDPPTLKDKITRAINCHGRESGSNTPDFILAEYLMRCLWNFDTTMGEREDWFRRSVEEEED